ncbi:MAG: dienelactone hydrolase family protein [Acidobacteria bacterium]|nr:dienelactone hydrolase family protein [Acidobacteriota bacterium]
MILSTLLLAAALPGTEALTREGDLALQMVDGIDRYLARRIQNDRPSAPPGRDRFRRIIGLADARLPNIELTRRAQLASTRAYDIHAVRWSVFENVDADGLLIEPKEQATCLAVAIPDADQTPEAVAQFYAVRLAENGCRTLIPTLIDRHDEWSGNPAIRMTNQPHREYIYRMAYQAGRHIIGYEVQKVLAAVDWLKAAHPQLPVLVSGYGEGGLIAFYSAAVDERIQTTVVSGYFRNRRTIHNEPIYRNVWSLLPNYGDAEIARLIAPRKLIIEAQRHPNVQGPPAARAGRLGAAPGSITTPAIEEVRAEIQRANAANITLIEKPGEATLQAFLGRDPKPPGTPPTLPKTDRMERQFRQLVEFTQRTVRNAERARKQYWSKADLTSPSAWANTRGYYEEQFQTEIIGRLPKPAGAPKPETRPIYDSHLFEGYEVYLPVYDEVFAYGVLLIPKGMKPGERRPLVIAQHGLEGRPQEIIQPTIPGEMRTYQRFAARLAERGFIVFAPQNPYIHGEKFRQLCRKGDPLQIGLFAFIGAQYSRAIDWLETLPFVDKDRIGFYGLSYGGATAVRVPAMEPRIKAVICSGNFNEWSWKITTEEHPFTYQFTREYEIYEFNQTNTFGHAEMATLIAPRPFFVERGHSDGVGIDEWVSYEYAKVRRLYAQWQIGDRTGIEFFNGVHQIWGHGAFEFLHRHLQWP